MSDVVAAAAALVALDENGPSHKDYCGTNHRSFPLPGDCDCGADQSHDDALLASGIALAHMILGSDRT